MICVPIPVELKKEKGLTGLVLCLIKDPGQLPLYGVYWNDAEIRQGGLDFRGAGELEWGEISEQSGEEEDEEEEEEVE